MDRPKKYNPKSKRTKKRNYKTGDFSIHGPKKYAGKPGTPIKYRSSYELKFMHQLEANPNVLWWNFENIRIPYIMVGIGGEKKRHNYIMDFQVKMLSGETFLCEVKPMAKTPLNESQINKSEDHRRNAFKWKAAMGWCKCNGHTFKIITERQLKI